MSALSALSSGGSDASLQARVIDPLQHVVARAAALSALESALGGALALPRAPPRHLRRRTTAHRRFALPRSKRPAAAAAGAEAQPGPRPREHRRRPSLLRAKWEGEARRALGSAAASAADGAPAPPPAAAAAGAAGAAAAVPPPAVPAMAPRWRLPTHAWHAKRFLMGAAPAAWGPLVLPLARRDVGLHALARWWRGCCSSSRSSSSSGEPEASAALPAASPPALAHDASYCLPVLLRAPSLQALAAWLGSHCDPAVCPPPPSQPPTQPPGAAEAAPAAAAPPAARPSARARRGAAKARWRAAQWPACSDPAPHCLFAPAALAGSSALQLWLHCRGRFPEAALAPATAVWLPPAGLADGAAPGSGVALLLLIHAAGAQAVVQALRAGAAEGGCGGCTVSWAGDGAAVVAAAAPAAAGASGAALPSGCPSLARLSVWGAGAVGVLERALGGSGWCSNLQPQLRSGSTGSTHFSPQCTRESWARSVLQAEAEAEAETAAAEPGAGASAGGGALVAGRKRARADEEGAAGSSSSSSSSPAPLQALVVHWRSVRGMCRVDVLLPRSQASQLWTRLQLAGAAALGLREWRSLHALTGLCLFPCDTPDTAAGAAWGQGCGDGGGDALISGGRARDRKSSAAPSAAPAAPQWAALWEEEQWRSSRGALAVIRTAQHAAFFIKRAGGEGEGETGEEEEQEEEQEEQEEEQLQLQKEEQEQEEEEEEQQPAQQQQQQHAFPALASVTPFPTLLTLAFRGLAGRLPTVGSPVTLLCAAHEAVGGGWAGGPALGCACPGRPAAAGFVLSACADAGGLARGLVALRAEAVQHAVGVGLAVHNQATGVWRRVALPARCSLTS